MRLATWGALPVASFVAVHYPQVASVVLTWLSPLLHAMR
jgi:hypothetical protein